MKNARRVFVLAFSMFSTACAQQVAWESTDPEHTSVFVAQDEALQRQMTYDAGWQLSPVVAASAPFGRAGIRFDASGPVDMQARVSSDEGATFGAWLPVNITFVEDIAHNGHVDVSTATTHVQVRYRAPVESRVTFLALDLFNYEPPTKGPVSLANESTVEQGLAAVGTTVRRSAWGAMQSQCTSGHRPNRMTIHHTVTPNNDSLSMAARMRQIQAYHMRDRGWCDIGYHFLVGQDGRVYEGRPENRLGAHVAGHNTNNSGISFIGDFSWVAPSSGQMAAAARIVRALSDNYGIPLNRSYLKGHREAAGPGSTACPGNGLANRLEELVALASGAQSVPNASASPASFCSPSKNGTYCDARDLVECRAGNEISRRHCEHGCASNPSGVPDQCEAPSSNGSGLSSVNFDDVPPSHYAYDAVQKLHQTIGIGGCSSTNFCPDDPLTRAQMANLLSALDGASFTAPYYATFQDVVWNHWAFEAVEEQTAKGVFYGCNTNEFCPDGPITWAYGAVLLQRALEIPPAYPDYATFADIPHHHWAFGAIEAVAGRELVKGCSTTHYCPAELMSRAQAAVVLVRAFGL